MLLPLAFIVSVLLNFVLTFVLLGFSDINSDAAGSITSLESDLQSTEDELKSKAFVLEQLQRNYDGALAEILILKGEVQRLQHQLELLKTEPSE
ncbi:hypothetical protein [Roseobacter sp. OBYS 0001]|uniref:hypothetical protein n=1 Tax=Roseobacter sp. OBYS 0001 TaxID=882651 RepID=UPI001BB9EF79|nr:hypothetical protein [Roseobacter sp. OBYS 0001]GIT86994.1 hypothetical protein ROBYS_20100 [Roseobacter sp. OBYS 0001]